MSSADGPVATQIAMTLTVSDTGDPNNVSKYKVPRLTVPDLQTIGVELIQLRKNKAIKICDESNKAFPQQKLIDSFEMAAILQQIEDKTPTIQDHYQAATTPEGCVRILGFALKKGGYTDADISYVIGYMGFDDQVSAATALVSCRPIKTAAADNKGVSNNPNPVGGGTKPIDLSGFGDPPPANSGETSATQPVGFSSPVTTDPQK